MLFYKHLVNHTKRHKEHITVHIRKHHKKYLFATGAVLGTCMFKIFVLASAFLGITIMTGRSNAADSKSEMYEALSILNQIDDIAHQRSEEMDEKGIFDHMSTDKTNCFHEIDKKFHHATNINERFRAAKKLYDFFMEQDEILHQSKKINPDRDRIFHETTDAFHKII